MKMKGTGIAILFAGLLALAVGSAYAEGGRDVTAEEAANLLKDNKEIVVLDVRTKAEFDEGHLEGALNLDVNGAAFRDEVSKLDKAKTYLVYCRSGKRSKMAQGIMEELGFKDAVNMKGGFVGWEKEGRPFKK